MSDMVWYENECCDCASPMYPCRGESCSFRRVPHYYCDKCKENVEELYEVDGEELCEDCLKDMFRRQG